MIHTRTFAAACLLGATAAAVAQQAPAPATPPDTPAAVAESPAAPAETVVITADKLRRGEAATTQSVALRSARQIQEQAASTVDEVISGMANIGTAQGLTIRGISLYGPTGGDGKMATVTVDGVTQDGYGQDITGLSVWDAAGVEVLRGPQSTNQGRNALAGAVVLKTRNPTDSWDLRGRATVTDQHSHSLALAGGGPLAGDVLAFRLSGEVRRDGGEITNITLNDPRWNRDDGSTLRGKLRLTPAGTDYQALLTLVDQHRTTGNGYIEASLFPVEDHKATSNEPWFARNHDRSLALEQTLNFAGADWTWLSTLARHDWNRVGDYDGTEQNQGASSGNAQDRQWSQELRANFERKLGGHTLRGVAGVYLANQKREQLDDFTVPVSYVLTIFGMCPDQTTCDALYPTDFVLRQNGVKQNVRNRALFAEADYEVGDLTFTAGLRHDQETQDRTVIAATSGNTDVAQQIVQLLLANGVAAPDGQQQLHTRYTAWLPKAALSWRFDPAWRAGLTVQRGYRTGGINYSYQRGANAFDPEYTTNYELSLKGKPTADSFVALNAYRVDWRDQQVNVGANSLDIFIVNAGRSRLQGLELEARSQLTHTLEAFGALGISRTRYIEFTDAAASYEGRQFPSSPRQTASAGLTWKPGPWTVYGEARYEGGTFSDAANSADQRNDAHTVLNTRVAWALNPKLRVFAYGSNLLDEVYTTYRWQNAPGREADYLGRGRTLGLGLEAEL
ncbi:MAG TPA: TonB-dependent receptor [Ideonella sp.]|uniref:TonB-dependent receptor n=1 Tax=Ideonella sp. TaxID=1929293 RepID=UPI002B5EC795|nr:TonB-dependent receptor [Ideonella sp.]HSI48758.1 TonB-dependent receptor [Ideonella sp.]